ncbi:MAG: uracil phosphoribosyltransferase [Flavobacteriales bacterium]
MLHILSQQPGLFNQFLSEIRDVNIQKDRMRFRRNLERIGEIAANEISKTLLHAEREVLTPLGIAPMMLLHEQPVICSIMRAGLPLHQGLMNYFDQADSSFVAAYRKHDSAERFEIEVDYMSSGSIENRILILADPMLATGASLEKVYRILLQRGKPAQIHIVSVIASRYGLNSLRAKLPEDVHFWIGAVDEELTAQSYIVPGLGDAGDLAFGSKSDG